LTLQSQKPVWYIYVHAYQGYTLCVQNKCKALDVDEINTVNCGTDMEPINVFNDVRYDIVALGE